LKLNETPIAGLFVIDIDRIEDDRGFFARTFCADEFRAHGLDAHMAQCNLSFNARKGTLRGMHYQKAPHEESKLVRCTMGAIHDVILDLRADSHTFGHSHGLRLSAENRRMLYVPKGCAHGYLTLCDDAEVFYQMGQPFVASAAHGVRWNDSAFGIVWPFQPSVISGRDATWPLWS
jgi:dTDP-4-dehydrorhamnose 3,5-epimerase